MRSYLKGVFFVELRRQDLNLRRPTSKHGRLLSLPLVSRHTPCFFAFGCSLHLPLAAVTPKAPGTRRSQSQNKKNTMLVHDVLWIAETGFEEYPLRKRKGTPMFQFLHETSSQQKNTTHLRVWCLFLNCGDRIWKLPHGQAHGDPDIPASAWDISDTTKKRHLKGRHS